MYRFCLSIIAGVGLLFLAHHASAQSPAAKTRASLDGPNAKADAKTAKTEAERIAKERRTQARSLLISLASDARSFRDHTLRARSLARIADALWNIDPEQGRTFFRNAWEAAEIADREGQERFSLGQERITLSQVRSNQSQVQLDLRNEVLKLAGRRDRLLAEEFLQRLRADQKETKAENSSPNLWGLSEAAQQRLNLARDLLSTGDIDRALQFADSVLGSVTMSTLDFLTQLREKNPVAADQRYAAMLASTGSNIQADANTISILSSYVFTPNLYVIFGTDGGASSAGLPGRPPANVGPQLRVAFFHAAAGVLLQPQPPPEQDQRTAGIVGTYMVVRRLMPLFEQYAPQEITSAIRGQFQALSSQISDDERQREKDWIEKGLTPEKVLADQEQSILDQIEHVKTSEERDGLYLKLALLALSKDDMRARDYVSKIEESWFRKQAQAWVDPCLAISAIAKKKIEVALEMARIGELTHIQRMWTLTQAAKLLAKTDRDKARSLVDDAATEARRIEEIDLDRPRGLLAVANALKLVEPSRAWDALFDAVKAANSAEGFTGEDGMLALELNGKSQLSYRKDGVPDFDLEGIFSKLANDDYDRAVQLTRGFQGEAPRANATIAIARSVLNEKSAPVITPQLPRKN
jgi:hypothetical protein